MRSLLSSLADVNFTCYYHPLLIQGAVAEDGGDVAFAFSECKCPLSAENGKTVLGTAVEGGLANFTFRR